MPRLSNENSLMEPSREKASTFQEHLNSALIEVRKHGLWRALRNVESAQGREITLNGKKILNFSSNDYLGLAAEPEIQDAAIQAIQTFGAGSGASRLISGSLAPHRQLESALADFKGCDAALTFSSGYVAAQAAICSLMGKADIVILDKLVHASIVDAAKLSGAAIRVYAHNGLNDLEAKLKWAAAKTQQPGTASQPRVLVVSESIFSMEGDAAPLPEIVDLKDKFGAWLMVDEAHATGLYGPHRRGLVDHFGLAGRVEVQMGTLGKALGSAGGYICGSRALIDFLINRARPFIFSTAPVPAASGAATAALRFIQSKHGAVRVKKLWENVRHFEQAIGRPEKAVPSVIIPIVLGESAAALNASQVLLEQNIFIPAVRFPSVPRGQARLRATISAAHASQDVDLLVAALKKVLPATK